MSRRKKIVIGVVVFIILSQLLRPLTDPIMDGFGDAYNAELTAVAEGDTVIDQALATVEAADDASDTITITIGEADE